MRDYLDFLRRCLKWAKSGVWGHVGNVSLLSGFLLAILTWCVPKWTHGHISERMSAFALGMIPLLCGASVFLFRLFFSPYPIYKNIKQKLDGYQNSERIRGQLCSYLLALEECQQELRKIGPPQLFLISESDVNGDNNLIDEIMRYIMQNVELSSGGVFLSDTGLNQVKGDNFYDRHLIMLGNRAAQLAKIINEYKVIKQPS